MNPSILFGDPGIGKHPWHLIPWDLRDMAIVCDCQLHLMVPGKQIEVPAMILSGSFQFSMLTPLLTAQVKAGSCQKCGIVWWTTDNVYALIKICEDRAAQMLKASSPGFIVNPEHSEDHGDEGHSKA